MTRHSDGTLQLNRPLCRDSGHSPVIPGALVLPHSLRGDIQQCSQLGLAADTLHCFSDGVSLVHSHQVGTFGSFCQGEPGTDISKVLAHLFDMDIKHAFAGRLNELLDEAGYPVKFKGRQEQLAAEFDVTPKTVSNWLKGIKLPAYERMLEIAVRFKVSPDWLQTGCGMKRPLSDKEQAHIEDLRELGVAEQERVYQVTRVFKDPPSDCAA